MTVTTEVTQNDQDRSEALKKAYRSATSLLREEKRDRFEELYVQEAKALGVEYTPRQTPEQKAEAELEALLTQFPHLRDKVAQTTS